MMVIKLIKYKLILVIFLLVFTVQFISAYTVNIPVNSGTSNVNYSTINTNNSLYWQGHTGTDGSWLTGISLVNSSYIPYQGATQDVNLGLFDFRANSVTTPNLYGVTGLLTTSGEIVPLVDDSDSLGTLGNAYNNLWLTRTAFISNIKINGTSGNVSGINNICYSNGTNCNIYNSTYHNKADYQFTTNNFNGSGNFTTTGNISVNHIKFTGSPAYSIMGTSESGQPFRMTAGNDNGWTNYVGGLDQNLNSFFQISGYQRTGYEGAITFRVVPTSQPNGIIDFQIGANNPKLRIMNTGAVSIGDTNASSRLSLGDTNADITQRIALYENPDSNIAFYGIGMAHPNDYGIGLYGGTGTNAPNNTNMNVFIERTGRVGINTTTPTSTLEVKGIINATKIISQTNFSVNNYQGITKNIQVVTTTYPLGCWENFTGGILTYTSC